MIPLRKVTKDVEVSDVDIMLNLYLLFNTIDVAVTMEELKGVILDDPVLIKRSSSEYIFGCYTMFVSILEDTDRAVTYGYLSEIAEREFLRNMYIQGSDDFIEELNRVSQIKDPVERAMSYFACILRFQPFSEYNTEVAWMIACKELKPIGKLMEVKKTDLKAFESACDRLVKDYEGYLPTFARMGRRICTSDIAL